MPKKTATGTGALTAPGWGSLKPIFRAAPGGRISDRVYNELVSAIRELRLRPGDPLSETDLAEQFGVSRTPIREAITRLVGQDLVRVVPQVGTTVCLIDTSAVEEACFVRSALETAAFDKACRLEFRDVSRLRQILAQQATAVKNQDGAAFFETDEDLHAEIFRLSGHENVWSLVLHSKIQLDRLRRLVLPLAISTDALIAEHVLLVDLLERGDVTAGRHLVHEHSLHILNQAPALRAEFPGYFS